MRLPPPALFLVSILVGIASSSGLSAADDAAAFRGLIEDDWERQEKRLGREPSDPASTVAALDRGDRLLESIRQARGEPGTFQEQAEALWNLRAKAAELDRAETGRSRALWREVRWLVRGLALRNPLFAGRPIAFLERRRFISQMLHEYLGYFYDYEDIGGGGVRVLERPGLSFETRDLTAERLGPGNYTTLSLSTDGRTAYFAYAPRGEGKPDFYSAEGRRSFHIHSVPVAGGDIRQLTQGLEDDFDPCPLPDGGIAFVSSRRGGFGRCHNPWEPLPVYTLHRIDADGGNIRALSFHETNEWHPSVLADGRIVYARWDYVDRSAAHFHGLWATAPDGSGAMVLFGNYTQEINACYQPRAIPGSRKIVFIAGAHHASVGGSLVVLDPDRARLDAETGHDRLDAIERLTPEVCFPEASGWPSSWFHAPWPLSEDVYLVGFSFDPLPGMGSGVKEDSRTGLYLFDRFGNLELLYRKDGISCMYPVPIGPAAGSAPAPRAPRIASNLDPSLGDEGEFILTDVRRSHFPLPAGRRVVALRIFQVLPKSETHVANQPRIGYANAESARMFLGTVPVEADGSAWFRVPARKPLYFQAVDGEGRAVQGMRSVVYVQPGERRGCVGCHEPVGTVPSARGLLALRRSPSRIEPGPDGTRPWSFPRLVQTILDARCLECHDGSAREALPASRLDLRGVSKGSFTASYESLRPFVRWYEWGDAGIEGFVTRPGRLGADESPLSAILADETHSALPDLTEAERRRILLWLDGNAAFYGTYEKRAEVAQKRGEAVPPPALE